MSRILAVAPHPDDETLGCGGTLLKHKAMGSEIFWLIMTGISTDAGFPAARVKAREKEIEAVSARYGFDGVFKLGFPATRLDTIPLANLIGSVSDVINKVKPDTVYLPHRGDIHSDHRVTFEAVASASKSFRATSIKKMMCYEVLSETEFEIGPQNRFAPNSFSDITGFLKDKLAIARIYKGEMGKHPFPRSEENIKALATTRGATAGIKYGESFILLKEIW